jgi:hypothetical protein
MFLYSLPPRKESRGYLHLQGIRGMHLQESETSTIFSERPSLSGLITRRRTLWGSHPTASA